MNKQIKDKWIAALLSGDYKQGHGRLVNDQENTYCCLGVLCELAAQENVVSKIGSTYNGSTCVLPPDVIKWAELDYSGEAGYIPEMGTALTILNDTGRSFKEIANVIEENL